MPNQDIGTILIKAKKLSKEQYQELQSKAMKANTSLYDVIVESGLVSDKILSVAYAKSIGLEFVDLVGHEVDLETLKIIPKELAKNYQAVAFEFDQKEKVLKVAMIDPKNLKAKEALDYIGRDKKIDIKYYLTDQEGIKHILKQYGNLEQEVGKALESAKERFEKKDDKTSSDILGKDVQEVIKHAPVSKMVSVILRHGVEGNASDIHIEVLEDKTRVRYRIDGNLKTSITLPIYIHDALVARIKVMANLKIDETRIPQDGRIKISLQDRDVEFRVSTLPLQEHEKVVMRILDTGGAALPLRKLGYKARNFEIIKHNIAKPNGMILITGPTGSGKSMTLFSCLNIVNSEDVNISTLEDPVEYRLPGINQSQIHPDVGFTFASGLRSLLRQDPDIIMVGEIRDLETAELAVHAAMTGHLVFSTLHTNSAVGAIPRLIDMKLQPFLIASTLNIVIAQRLVKRICNECKQEAELASSLKEEFSKDISKIDSKILERYGNINLENPVFYQGKGCAKCSNSGFKGRTAITEVIEIDRNLKEVIASGMKQADLDQVLEKQKFLTMKQDGFVKAALGITTLEQVLAVTKEGN